MGGATVERAGKEIILYAAHETGNIFFQISNMQVSFRLFVISIK